MLKSGVNKGIFRIVTETKKINQKINKLTPKPRAEGSSPSAPATEKPLKHHV